MVKDEIDLIVFGRDGITEIKKELRKGSCHTTISDAKNRESSAETILPRFLPLLQRFTISKHFTDFEKYAIAGFKLERFLIHSTGTHFETRLIVISFSDCSAIILSIQRAAFLPFLHTSGRDNSKKSRNSLSESIPTFATPNASVSNFIRNPTGRQGNLILVKEEPGVTVSSKQQTRLDTGKQRRSSDIWTPSPTTSLCPATKLFMCLNLDHRKLCVKLKYNPCSNTTIFAHANIFEKTCPDEILVIFETTDGLSGTKLGSILRVVKIPDSISLKYPSKQILAVIFGSIEKQISALYGIVKYENKLQFGHGDDIEWSSKCVHGLTRNEILNWEYRKCLVSSPFAYGPAIFDEKSQQISMISLNNDFPKYIEIFIVFVSGRTKYCEFKLISVVLNNLKIKFSINASNGNVSMCLLCSFICEQSKQHISGVYVQYMTVFANRFSSEKSVPSIISADSGRYWITVKNICFLMACLTDPHLVINDICFLIAS